MHSQIAVFQFTQNWEWMKIKNISAYLAELIRHVIEG